MFTTKNLLLDTSVLVSNPEIFNKLSDHNLFLTIEVLEELDKLKTYKDEVGKNARWVNKYLDSVRAEQSLISGAELDNGSRLYVINGKGYIHESFIDGSNDNKIISVAYKLKKEIGSICVLTNDIAFRLKCDSLGIEAFEYSDAKKAVRDDEKFAGMTVVDVHREDMDLFHENGALYLHDERFYFNECVILKCGQVSGLAMAKGPSYVEGLKYAVGKGVSIEGLKPRTAEQTFALELLLDPEIALVTLTGKAGTGKTLLSIASAMHGLHNRQYDKIILSRPVESASKDIGFLPGDKSEKLLPWIQPFIDNLKIIYKKGDGYIQQMMETGKIEFEALTYIRGRSLPNTFFIIDEAQNINYHEAKALVTRMGIGSKLVLIGDLEQIDSLKLDSRTSGLAHAVEVFKDFEGAGHLVLMRGERSPLATFAAENM